MTMQPLKRALSEWQSWGLNLQQIPAVTQHFDSGLTNSIFLLECHDEPLILRLNNPNSAELGINRDHEQTILQALQPLNIAPQLHFSASNFDYSVFQYIAGQRYDVSPVVDNENRAIAQLIEKIQSVPLTGLPVFNYQKHLERYWDSLRPSLKVGNLRLAWRKFHAELEAFQEAGWQPVLCHHDINPSNIIQQDNRLILLDWEYAGLGHPEIDLYMATGNVTATPFIADLVYWMEKLWYLLRNP